MKFKPLITGAVALLMSVGLMPTADPAGAAPKKTQARVMMTGAYPEDTDFRKLTIADLEAHRRISALSQPLNDLAEGAKRESYTVDLTHGVPNLDQPPGIGDPIKDCQNVDISNREKGKVISHFQYCDHGRSALEYYADSDQTKPPIGEISWDWVIIGLGHNGSRVIYLTLQFSNFDKWGDTSLAPDPSLRGEIYCFPGLGDSGGCDQSNQGDLTTERRVSEWKQNPQAYFTLKSADTNGLGREKVNISGWQLLFEALEVHSSATVIRQTARFDTATYDAGGKGAIFNDVMPHITYSRGKSSDVREVAQHIYDACNNPSMTKPIITNKIIAGCTDNNPLHRLYYDAKRRRNNNAAARRVCKKYWGPNYTNGGKECDEFPFQSTYEGAWRDKAEPGFPYGMFSARPLNGTQNGRAGNLLGDWYSKDRIIDWSWTENGQTWKDPFTVWIR